MPEFLLPPKFPEDRERSRFFQVAEVFAGPGVLETLKHVTSEILLLSNTRIHAMTSANANAATEESSRARRVVSLAILLRFG